MVRGCPQTWQSWMLPADSMGLAFIILIATLNTGFPHDPPPKADIILAPRQPGEKKLVCVRVWQIHTFTTTTMIHITSYQERGRGLRSASGSWSRCPPLTCDQVQQGPPFIPPRGWGGCPGGWPGVCRAVKHLQARGGAGWAPTQCALTWES